MERAMKLLNCNKYYQTAFYEMKKLRDDELFVDSTIVCNEKQYPVHRVVLSSCSSYFRRIFEQNHCYYPIVIMNDIHHQDLEVLINFMYEGKVTVPQNRLSFVMKEGKALKIKGFDDTNDLQVCLASEESESLSYQQVKMSCANEDKILKISDKNSVDYCNSKQQSKNFTPENDAAVEVNDSTVSKNSENLNQLLVKHEYGNVCSSDNFSEKLDDISSCKSSNPRTKRQRASQRLVSKKCRHKEIKSESELSEHSLKGIHEAINDIEGDRLVSELLPSIKKELETIESLDHSSYEQFWESCKLSITKDSGNVDNEWLSGDAMNLPVEAILLSDVEEQASGHMRDTPQTSHMQFALNECKDNSKVTVLLSGSAEDCRKWKVQYCTYCSKSITNFSKHILNRHRNEKEVCEIISLPLKSLQRKILFEKLRNIGNYKHNCDIIMKGEGVLIPWRCPPYPVPASQFVACEHCYGFFQKKEMYKHIRKCNFNYFSGTNFDFVGYSETNNSNCSSNLKEGISKEECNNVNNSEESNFTDNIKEASCDYIENKEKCNFMYNETENI